MSKTEQEIEQLKEQEEVRTALRQTAGTKESMPVPTPDKREQAWLGTYLLGLLLLLALYIMLGSDFIPVNNQYFPTLRSLLMGLFLIVLTVTVAKAIRVYLGHYYKHLGSIFLTAPMVVRERVIAQWWFDRHGRLIDIAVDQQASVY